MTVWNEKRSARISKRPALLRAIPSSSSSHHFPDDALQIPAAAVHPPAIRASMPRNTTVPFIANSLKVKLSAELRMRKTVTEHSKARKPRRNNKHQFLIRVSIMPDLRAKNGFYQSTITTSLGKVHLRLCRVRPARIIGKDGWVNCDMRHSPLPPGLPPLKKGFRPRKLEHSNFPVLAQKRTCTSKMCLQTGHHEK